MVKAIKPKSSETAPVRDAPCLTLTCFACGQRHAHVELCIYLLALFLIGVFAGNVMHMKNCVLTCLPYEDKEMPDVQASQGGKHATIVVSD